MGREFSMAVARIREGMPLDARNVEISEATLARFLHALKGDDTFGPELPKADFGNATFTGRADFSRVVFAQQARFSDATFRGELRLAGAIFLAGARFRETHFTANAVFNEAEFKSGAYFTAAVFDREAGFERATIQGPASFSDVEFKGGVSFAKTTFDGNAHFGETTFAAAAKFDRAQFLGNAYFRGTTFHGQVDYFKANFKRIAFFERACFEDEALFRKAEFTEDARFHGAILNSASFKNSRFKSTAIFGKARFGGLADFKGTVFGRSAAFSTTRFNGPAHFGGAVFERDAGFREATFGVGARFAGARFEGEVRFDGTACNGDAGFQRAAFKRARQFGPLRAERFLLDGAVFHDHVRIEIEADALSARGATFIAGTHLRVRRADVFLEDADFVRQATLLGVQDRPRLISLHGAHVAPLVLSDIDLRMCSFFGAHGLESMRIEASCLWPSTPGGWWASKRETIAEEHRWRSSSQAGNWTQKARAALRLPAPTPWWEGETPTFGNGGGRDRSLEPSQIAAVYRALRKAREDNKDEAGAGDLYYGEMEMRRHAGSNAAAGETSRSVGERTVLMAYWIVSGYGLRALRSLASLILVLLVGAALLSWFGFHDPYDYGQAVLFATESSISVLRPPESSLSAGGQAVQICLRLLGPLFFGLALLAVRARVKR
jgi:hypothetical protein